MNKGCAVIFFTFWLKSNLLELYSSLAISVSYRLKGTSKIIFLNYENIFPPLSGVD